jgi:hypothetical protein
MRKSVTYHNLTGTVREWADFLGMNYYTLLARLRRGWPAEKALEAPLQHHGAGPKTHGRTASKEYVAWKAMLERCRYPHYQGWGRYGGRGLEVCQRWKKDFQAFMNDVGVAPASHFSLGRINNDLGYKPGNVSWQSAKEQANNRAKPRHK